MKNFEGIDEVQDMITLPLVTIYIPCHNYARFLTKAVESVLQQSYQEWELFIVDDGSTDDSQTVARKLQSVQSEKITIIANESSIGLQRIANNILGLANGTFILRLDADDWLDESALLIMVERIQRDPRLGLVYGGYYYVDIDGNIIGIEKHQRLWDEDKSGSNPPHGACTLVRTRSLKAVGGYSLDVTAQDGWELWFKLVNRIRSASIGTPLFYYRQHSNSLSQDHKRLYNSRAKIFSKMRDKNSGDFKPKILAVIPVRESYPQHVGVPFTSLGSKTLLEHVISVAQDVDSITTILISTDSKAVEVYVEELIADGKVRPLICVNRNSQFTKDFVPLHQILEHAGNVYHKFTDQYPDVVTFLSLHAPLRDVTSINKALDVLLVTEADTVVSVVEEREPIFMHSEHGIKLIGTGRFDGLFHQREQVFKFSGDTLVVWWDVIKAGSVWGQKIGYVEMVPEESVQLKRPDDIERVLELLKKRMQNNIIDQEAG